MTAPALVGVLLAAFALTWFVVVFVLAPLTVGYEVRRNTTPYRFCAIVGACMVRDHDAAREWIIKDLGGAP